MKTRTTIHEFEKLHLDKKLYKYESIGDFYMTELIRKANELGLQGKKITEIVSITSPSSGNIYIDYITQ